MFMIFAPFGARSTLVFCGIFLSTFMSANSILFNMASSIPTAMFLFTKLYLFPLFIFSSPLY